MIIQCGRILVANYVSTIEVRIPESRKDLLEAADKANYESALKVTGIVADRGSSRNPAMKTGDIEIVVDDLKVLNNAPNRLPYSLRAESESVEETRLRYRYLDLRSDRMQQALRLRSEVAHLMRKFLIEIANFVEGSFFVFQFIFVINRFYCYFFTFFSLYSRNICCRENILTALT
uniref:Aminoacyl-tRNA synthetase class II (D/K/N) domain-containing protein n=1 Tax=Parascaris univalens TaxID=6257 RepID=A0A915BTB8_PARUN